MTTALYALTNVELLPVVLELLAALKGLLPEEAGTKECNCGCEGDGEGMCDYAEALDAIAKAKGETP
mgnify:CR=1 FL=1